MSGPAVLGCAAAALILALPVMTVSAHLEARHRAAGAADAAALAAADAAAGWIDAEPCAIAGEVADSAHARLTSCTVDAERAEAAVTVHIATPITVVSGRARAGPDTAVS